MRVCDKTRARTLNSHALSSLFERALTVPSELEQLHNAAAARVYSVVFHNFPAPRQLTSIAFRARPGEADKVHSRLVQFGWLRNVWDTSDCQTGQFLAELTTTKKMGRATCTAGER